MLDDLNCFHRRTVRYYRWATWALQYSKALNLGQDGDHQTYKTFLEEECVRQESMCLKPVQNR